MEHVSSWCFRGIYKGGLWEDDLHVSAQSESSIGTVNRAKFDAQKLILMAFFLLMFGIHARNVLCDITNCARVDATSESSNQGHSEVKGQIGAF